jgi:hypothetical protein
MDSSWTLDTDASRHPHCRQQHVEITIEIAIKIASGGGC